MYAIVKSAVLLLSVLGYAMYYQKRRFPLCFFPITLISGVTVTVYLAGLIGFLKIACYAVLLPGLLLLVRCFSLKRLKELVCDPAILFTVFAGAWVFMITRGAMLAHNDDGTHWFRIIKAMNYEDAYPTTPDIRYYEYVPGCATWVYFVTRFIQFQIDNTMFAQNLMNVACVATLFSACGWAKNIREKGIVFGLVAAAGVLLCCITETTYALLVDAQVGLVAMAALIMALEMKKEGMPSLLTAVVLCMLALIKNSGLLFVVIITIWACLWYKTSTKEWIKNISLWMILPLLLNGLYAIRSDLVYGQDAIGAQGVSLERYASLFAGKSADVVRQITVNLFSSILSGKLVTSVTMYGCALLYVLFIFCLMEREQEALKKVKTREILLGSVLILAAYSVGLLGTYLFSMTEIEGVYLFSFERYFGVVLIVLVGTAVWYALKLAGEAGNIRRFVLSLILLFVVLAPGKISKRHFLGEHEYQLPHNYRSQVWRTMEIFVPQNQHYTENSYVLLWDEDDFLDGGLLKGRLTALAETWLRSLNIVNIPDSEIRDGLSEETLKAVSRCDYLVCISDMEEHRELFLPYLGNTDMGMGLREIPKDLIGQNK